MKFIKNNVSYDLKKTLFLYLSKKISFKYLVNLQHSFFTKYLCPILHFIILRIVFKMNFKFLTLNIIKIKKL